MPTVYKTVEGQERFEAVQKMDSAANKRKSASLSLSRPPPPTDGLQKNLNTKFTDAQTCGWDNLLLISLGEGLYKRLLAFTCDEAGIKNSEATARGNATWTAQTKVSNYFWERETEQCWLLIVKEERKTEHTTFGGKKNLHHP